MSVSEMEKENSGGRSDFHEERKFALVQGLSHPKSYVNRHGIVKFGKVYVSFAALLVFRRDALYGTGYDDHAKNREIVIAIDDSLHGAERSGCATCEMELPLEFPLKSNMLQLAAMKKAILTGMAHEQSGINLWHMDYVCSSVMASPVLLFLHRDALNGTVLEKPEYLPGHNFEVYAGA